MPTARVPVYSSGISAERRRTRLREQRKLQNSTTVLRDVPKRADPSWKNGPALILRRDICTTSRYAVIRWQIRHDLALRLIARRGA